MFAVIFSIHTVKYILHLLLTSFETLVNLFILFFSTSFFLI